MLPEEEKRLKIAAAKIRMGVITGVGHAGCGHPGGALSCADMLSVLYFKAVSYTHLDVYKRQTSCVQPLHAVVLQHKRGPGQGAHLHRKASFCKTGKKKQPLRPRRSGCLGNRSV